MYGAAYVRTRVFTGWRASMAADSAELEISEELAMASTDNEECPTETEVITEELPEAARSAGEEEREAELEEQTVIVGEIEASLQTAPTEDSELRPAAEETEEALVTGRDEEIENYQSTVRELSAELISRGEELGAHYLAYISTASIAF